jgi:hypothetical protein
MILMDEALFIKMDRASVSKLAIAMNNCNPTLRHRYIPQPHPGNYAGRKSAPVF